MAHRSTSWGSRICAPSLLALVLIVGGCGDGGGGDPDSTPTPTATPDPTDATPTPTHTPTPTSSRSPGDPSGSLVAEGARLFFQETFDGNGRTCGTCHPSANNFTLSPQFIATLSADDPLFVAERCGERQYKGQRPTLGTMSTSLSENAARKSINPWRGE